MEPQTTIKEKLFNKRITIQNLQECSAPIQDSFLRRPALDVRPSISNALDLLRHRRKTFTQSNPTLSPKTTVELPQNQLITDSFLEELAQEPPFFKISNIKEEFGKFMKLKKDEGKKKRQESARDGERRGLSLTASHP